MRNILAAMAIAPLLTFLAAGCDMSATNATPSPVHSYQIIEGFFDPSSCAFSLDGKYLYVTNAASALNQGGVSRLEINAAGKATLTEQTFIRNISAHSIAVLPKAIQKHPAGTLFIADATTVYVHDAETGKELDRINGVDKDGCVNRMLDVPYGSLGINRLVFDAGGNLYLALVRARALRVVGHPYIIRIPHAALDAMLAGEAGEGISPMKLPVRTPIHALLAVHDQNVYVSLTENAEFPQAAVYSVPAGTLDAQQKTRIVGGLGEISGIAFTPAGSMIMARPGSEDLFVLDADGQAGRNLPLGFPLQNPRNLAIHALPDGGSLLAVPQPDDPTKAHVKTSTVLLLHLPAGF